MEFKLHPFNFFDNYKYADIFALYKGKWIFCKHNERITWEHAGGHIEQGETPLEAAKRELFEETGATVFDIYPLCDYWVHGEIGGSLLTAHGQLFFAAVYTLGEIPENSEMEKIDFFDTLPCDLTYPWFEEEPFKMAQAKKMELGL